LVVNARFLGRRVTGVERYAREITRRLPGEPRLLRPRGEARGLRGHLWEQLVLPRLAGNQLLWSPANTGPLLASRQVVTLHDASAVEHPEWFHPAFAAWYRFLLPRLARRALKVLTVSHASRDRLARAFGLDPDKVAVIPPGVDPAQFRPRSARVTNAVRARYCLPETFVLFVGSPSPRKNLPTLFRAWQDVAAEFPRAGLVIAGAGAAQFAGAQFARAGGEPAPGACFLGYVPDAHLAALYSAARALVIPSLDEGFGLTALEAMACGVPVIAAGRGGLPEAAGEAALTVDPGSPEALARGITALLADPELHRCLAGRGLERAARFTWEAAAQAVNRELESADRMAG